MGAVVEAKVLLAGTWEVVIVATGGVPARPDVPGGHLVGDTWDVLAGTKRLRGQVLVYDDHGGNQALDAVEALLAGDATAVLATPEWAVSPDVGAWWRAAGYFDAFARGRVQVGVLQRLPSVERDGSELVVRFGLDGSHHQVERRSDAVVAEIGTTPVKELYDELVGASTNLGEIDFRDLLEGRPQTSVRNQEDRSRLYRRRRRRPQRARGMLDAARLCRTV